MTKDRKVRDVMAERIAATLPDQEAALYEHAKAALIGFHDATLAEDEEAAKAAQMDYEAVVWKLNGGTFFGCEAEDDSPGELVRAYCAAPDGAIPAWGQKGRFLIMVDGIRSVVEARGLSWQDFDYCVVDTARPFISPTGYRSDYPFGYPAFGKTVEEYARSRFAELIEQEGLEAVEPKYRKRTEYHWIPSLEEIPVVVRQDEGGQLALVL